MTITKEQFQTFKQYFKIMEITRATVESTADLDLEDFEEYQDHPDDFFLDTNWNHYPTDVTASDGYCIQYTPSDDFVKQISSINDVAAFIENDMNDYLAKHQQKGKSND